MSLGLWVRIAAAGIADNVCAGPNRWGQEGTLPLGVLIGVGTLRAQTE